MSYKRSYRQQAITCVCVCVCVFPHTACSASSCPPNSSPPWKPSARLPTKDCFTLNFVSLNEISLIKSPLGRTTPLSTPQPPHQHHHSPRSELPSCGLIAPGALIDHWTFSRGTGEVILVRTGLSSSVELLVSVKKKKLKPGLEKRSLSSSIVMMSLVAWKRPLHLQRCRAQVTRVPTTCP